MGKYVCVGLDPDWRKIPNDFTQRHDGLPQNEMIGGVLEEICRRVVDATYDVAAAFKPNIAFFEAHGSAGLLGLEHLIRYICSAYPDIPIILDAKRGDIGNTCLQYVQYAFDRLQVHAVTVNPYLGHDALAPYLTENYPDRGVIVLCKTSNPGSEEFQDRETRMSRDEFTELFGHQALGRRFRTSETVAAIPFYEYVAGRVNAHWNTQKNCWLVVGATHPNQLAELSELVDLPMLLPGFGKQGASIEDTIPLMQGRLFLANSSSGIMFACNQEEYVDKSLDEAAKAAAIAFNNDIAAALAV